MLVVVMDMQEMVTLGEELTATDAMEAVTGEMERGVEEDPGSGITLIAKPSLH